VKADVECLACVAQQALSAARVASQDPAVQQRIVAETMARVHAASLDTTPAWLSQPAYEIAREISGSDDPYLKLKRASNEMALAIEDDLRALVRESDDPLSAALHLAAAGNVVDLGIFRSEDIDIHSTVEQVMRERFAIDHTDALRTALKQCNDLLYLLDNAGEIVFDKILIEELLKHTPVTAVVKQGAIINDALHEDAEQVGLTALCPVIDNGGAFIGAPLDHVPESFLQRMGQADVILAKGQGNYETVDEFDGNVFLVLRAKCAVVAKHMGVEYGQVGLISTRVRRMAR
jgi:uncharacterized protein with ATP-grasp and redox domains